MKCCEHPALVPNNSSRLQHTPSYCPGDMFRTLTFQWVGGDIEWQYDKDPSYSLLAKLHGRQECLRPERHD